MTIPFSGRVESGFGSEKKKVESENDKKKRSRQKSIFSGKFKNCRILKKVGAGTFGSVYQAEDKDNKIIAVKTVESQPFAIENDQDAHEKRLTQEIISLRKEIEILKSLDHPNIVKLLDFEEPTTVECNRKLTISMAIYMEYLSSGSLSDRIATRKQGFSEGTTRKYLIQLLNALVYLHDQGIIHRDLKSANILMTEEGSVKLADFGSAKQLLGDMFKTVEHTQTIGTGTHQAPEVICTSNYNCKVDIWSLGCVIVEMVTGRRPFYDMQIENSVNLMFQIATSDISPSLPPSASPLLCDFLAKCCMRSSKYNLMHFACKRGVTHLVQFLLMQKGGVQSLYMRGRDGATPIDLANDSGNFSIVSLLKQHMDPEINSEPETTDISSRMKRKLRPIINKSLELFHSGKYSELKECISKSKVDISRIISEYDAELRPSARELLKHPFILDDAHDLERR